MSLSHAPRPARVVPIQAAPSATALTGAMPGALPLPDGQPFDPLTHGPAVPAPPDALGRPLRDLRISVTDRCNFRCGYCMPRSVFGHDHAFLPHAEILSFEEITRAARIAAALGVRKIRLTGGEPLLRKDLPALIAQLSALRTPEGTPLQLALTTNGILLGRQASALREAGLHRVTVSLDALDEAVFQRMSDTRLRVGDVLDGIAAAQAAGLGPVKVNMVVQRGVNDDQILPLVAHFRGSGVELRFIEFMDVGETNRWDMAHVMPSDEVRARITPVFPLVPADGRAKGVTAERWAHADGGGYVGFISSVTQAFCGDCTRLRLSTDGRLYTCLFGTRAWDLRGPLRDPALDDQAIAARLAALWAQRGDRYSELRGRPGAPADTMLAPAAPRVEMSYIGG